MLTLAGIGAVVSVEGFDGGVNRLPTLTFTAADCGALTLEGSEYFCEDVVGGNCDSCGWGSSKLGRLFAAERREVNDGWVFSASSAVPIPGGGIARVARLTEEPRDWPEGRKRSVSKAGEEDGVLVGGNCPAGSVG